MKTVFLFSGQGAQYCGMGKELIEQFPVASGEILSCGSEILGFDLKKTLLEASAEELAQTVVSQPSIFTMSLLALNAAKEAGISYQAVAGHSLGEYAAMVASNMLTVEQGFTAIKNRAYAMDKAAKANPGGMAAVLGLDSGKIEEICAEITASDEYITPVNYNSPAQTVVAGTKEAISQAEAAMKTAGAKRVVLLAVSAAFHSKLMQSAAEEFRTLISDMKFSAPSVAFYANVYGKQLTDFSDMPAYLSAHICSPVRFVDELECMKNDGFDNFVELGPNKVLTGLVKKTLPDVRAVNVENTATLEAAAI